MKSIILTMTAMLGMYFVPAIKMKRNRCHKRPNLVECPLSLPRGCDKWNLTVTTNNTYVGSRGIVKCPAGHSLIGNANISCSEDGVWRPINALCLFFPFIGLEFKNGGSYVWQSGNTTESNMFDNWANKVFPEGGSCVYIDSRPNTYKWRDRSEDSCNYTKNFNYICESRLIFAGILLADFVVTNLNKRVKAGKRNRSFDNRRKTGNVLRQFTNTNAFSCLALCSEDIDCRSVAYNSNDGRCQEFNRDFTNQPIVGIYQVGWRHFDVSKGAACKDRPNTARDCDDVQSQGYTCSGVYTISLRPGSSLPVWCDLQTAGGRWTIFQHRRDGSVNFDMNWSSYKDGFGNPYTEVWLGNDNLYTLTSSRKTELLILMEAWDGVWKYASYSEFYINSEFDKYRLRVSGFNGTAGDSLVYMMTSPQGGHQFSTRDRDNDAWAGSCNPFHHRGGFWFNGCGASDLNGLYYSSAVDLAASCNWYTFSNNRQSLKTIFMMVRKV